MKNRTLEEIIRAEQSHRHEGGQFGINACKKSISFSVEYLGENLADLLNEYVERANTDVFFNKAMVLACWELMQEAEAEAEAETEAAKEMMNETKKAEIMAIVDRLCADNGTDCRGLSLSGVASDLLDAVGIDPYLDIFEIPVHSDSQACICFWFNGEPFELWAGLSYETKEFFTECRRWSEDANGEIVDFSIFAETEEEPTETEATEEDKTMKNYINRRGEDADRINAVIEAYEATRDGKTADTVNRLVEAMGRTGAAVAVASVVNAVSLHDGRISDRVREWAQGVEGAPTNEELHALGIYGVDSWMHSAHVDNLGAAMRRWLKDNPPTESETIEEEPTEEENTPHIVISAPAWKTPTEEEAKQDAPSVCEGCRFFDACGDADRVEPCEGFETAPNFGTGHDILKSNTFGHTRNLMRALNAVFGFDFCAPYHVAEINGKYTVNKIRKAVEAVAPLYAVNRYAFRVVALCSVDRPTYYAGRLYAVEITPNGFDVDRARGVNQSRFSSSNSFDYCYKKAQFDELRKEESARCFVVVQASEHLRPVQVKSWRCSDLVKPDERYDLEKVNYFCYEVGGASYIGGLDMRTRTASGELIRYEAPHHGKHDAIPAENVGEVIDKSGYLLQERRADLKRRADQARAEKARAAYQETDNREKVETLRTIIGAKRHALAYELEHAETAEAVTTLYKKLRNYGDGFARIVEDFDRFEARTNAKSYPSIEASEKAYSDILARLMA